MTPDLVVDPTAAAEIRDHGSAAQLVVHGCTDRAAALAALALAADDVWAVPHPDEPDSPLPSFVDVADTYDGPRLWFDLKDEGPLFAGRIVELVARRLREAGVGGVLRGAHDVDAADEDTDDQPYRVREWSLEQPGRPWPADLPSPSDSAPTVLGARRHGEGWLLAHWDVAGSGEADRVVAQFAADGWAVSPVPPGQADDADLVGPFSEGASAPGLRLWRAERDGRRVVVGTAASPAGVMLRLTTPLEDVPAARPTAATPVWPPGFPADLPPVPDAATPPMVGAAPGTDGREWLQAQLGRRSTEHPAAFVDALTATGWSLAADDDRARQSLEAAFAGRGGVDARADLRGWSAKRGDEQLYLISLLVPGTGAVLVVSTPAA